MFLAQGYRTIVPKNLRNLRRAYPETVLISTQETLINLTTGAAPKLKNSSKIKSCKYTFFKPANETPGAIYELILHHRTPCGYLNSVRVQALPALSSTFGSRPKKTKTKTASFFSIRRITPFWKIPTARWLRVQCTDQEILRAYIFPHTKHPAQVFCFAFYIILCFWFAVGLAGCTKISFTIFIIVCARTQSSSTRHHPEFNYPLHVQRRRQRICGTIRCANPEHFFATLDWDCIFFSGALFGDIRGESHSVSRLFVLHQIFNAALSCYH